MQQLPNVKDETCKNQDGAVLVSKRRHREAENKSVRGEGRKAERLRPKRQEREERQTGFVLITGEGEEREKLLLVRLWFWIKHNIYISD